TLSITGTTTPQHGTALVLNNKVLYTPAAGFNGTDTFTYTITDGKGATATANVTVTVGVANRPPVAVNDAFTVQQNSSNNSFNVLANDSDPDGDPLTIIAVTQPPIGTVAISADKKTVAYTKPLTFNQTKFTYTISHGRGGTATATVTVTDP